MSELKRKEEAFKDTLILLNDVEMMARKAIADIVKEISGYDTYIGFNDETAYPYFMNSADDMGEAVVGVRVRLNKDGEDELQFCTYARGADDDVNWFCPYYYGDFDMESLYECITDYAELHGIE